MSAIETADAIGRSLIVQKDRNHANRTLATEFSNWFVCEDNIVSISFDLIPKDVLEYIRYKSVTISGVEDAELLEAVKEKVRRAIEEGTDFKDFKREVNQIFDSYGVTRIAHNHLQTVFRTNVFSAYAIGQLEQVKLMRDRFPLWRFMAIKDNRTRPLHRELDGKVFRVGEGPIPPIDFNCRCTAQYLHESEAAGLEPDAWTSNNKVVRFDVREAFEDWVKSKDDLLSPKIKGWIQSRT